MAMLKLDNQTLQRIKDTAVAKWKETTLRHIEPELFVTYCVLKAVEAECKRQNVAFELDLPPRHIVEPDDV